MYELEISALEAFIFWDVLNTGRGWYELSALGPAPVYIIK